ncbi:MAG: hypothetical protein JXR30_00390 [Alphaproteobacteria bacterium]|nr:hypothetical protein [Alphaproteobacteria bacterium]
MKICKANFYEWAYSNLLTNNQRGVLAEYIVAFSLGEDKIKREEWDAYDILHNNIKIEVKSSSYLQVWEQKKLSNVLFDISPKRKLNLNTNKYDEDIKRQSDVYVFCLLKHKDKKTVNVLDLSQWVFYVVKTSVLNEKLGNQKKISLSTLSRLNINECSFNEIRNLVNKI